MMATGEQALCTLAEMLKNEGGLLSPHVVSEASLTADGGVLGGLVAGGSRVAGNEHEYALVIEAVHEGYLLHYGRPRLLTEIDPDLALLAGDYLYALGLERLSRLNDPEAVALLGDLISLVALCQAEGLERCIEPLWLATTIAVASGATPEIEAAKVALNELETASEQALWQSAQSAAEDSDMGHELLLAAKAIDFPPVND